MDQTDAQKGCQNDRFGKDSRGIFCSFSACSDEHISEIEAVEKERLTR